MTPAATNLEVGINLGGLLWALTLAALAFVGYYVYRRQREGLAPLNAISIAVALVAGAGLLLLVLGPAGLAVGVVLFLIYLLARLVG